MKVLILLFLVSLTRTAQAGNILIYDTPLDSDGITKIFVLPERVRVEYRSGKRNFALIYRGDKHLIWLLEFDQHTATENFEKNLESSRDEHRVTKDHVHVNFRNWGLEKDSVEALERMEEMLKLLKNQPVIGRPSIVKQSTKIRDDLFEIPKGFQKFNLIENIKIHSDSKQ